MHACADNLCVAVFRNQQRDVENVHGGMAFDSLIARGVIEYVDVNEENDTMVRWLS